MIIEGQYPYSEISQTQSVNTTANRPQSAVAVASPVPAGPPLPQTIDSRSSDTISQFHSWFLLANTQSELSELQASEYSLALLYRQFGNLAQQLGQTPSETLANQLKQWASQLDAQSGLDRQLQPRGMQPNGARVDYILEKADLLSTRPKDETLIFFFRDTRNSLSITLPANASRGELLMRLQQGLLAEDIQVSINAKGQLVLSVNEDDKSKLDRPILLSGDGYRIPAGNPVTVKFQAQPSLLESLIEQLLSLQPAQFSAFAEELERYRRRMRATIGLLKKHRQNLMSELAEQEAELEETPIEQLSDIRDQIQSQLQIDGYRATALNLNAQANLSRKNVIALLAENG